MGKFHLLVQEQFNFWLWKFQWQVVENFIDEWSLCSCYVLSFMFLCFCYGTSTLNDDIKIKMSEGL